MSSYFNRNKDTTFKNSCLYTDASTLLFELKEYDLGVRILSTLAEIEIDNPQYLRFTHN